jgi:hypothetical protein
MITNMKKSILIPTILVMATGLTLVVVAVIRHQSKPSSSAPRNPVPALAEPKPSPPLPSGVASTATPSSFNVPEAELPPLAERDFRAEAERVIATHDRSYMELLYEWAEKDLSGFAEWVRRRPTDDSERNSIRCAQTIVWAKHDPLEAAKWVLQLPKAELRCPLYPALAGCWAERDISAALQWCQQLPEAETGSRGQIIPIRKMALKGVLTTWSNKDPEAAAKWVEQWPEGDAFRSGMLTQVAACLYNKNPSAAVAWVQSLPDNNKDRLNEALARCQVQHLVKNEGDFQTVLAAVNELPAPVRQTGLQTMIAWWSVKDDPESLKALDQWMSAQPSQEFQAQCVAALGNIGGSNLSVQNRLFRLKWFSRQLEWEQNEGGRDVAQCSLENQLRALKTLSPQAAAKWLGEASLSEKHKAKLRQALD